MKRKSLIVLLLALCALLCACVPESPAPDENGFYAVGDEIVFANELGEEFATFCITEVLISDELHSAAASDMGDRRVIGISYEIEFAQSGRAVDQNCFKVTDSNGDEATFLRKTGISGEEMTAQTLEYGVKSTENYVDIRFVYDEALGYTADVRAYIEPDTAFTLDDFLEQDEESMFDEPVIRWLNIFGAVATAVIILLALVIIKKVHSARAARRLAENDKREAELAAKAQFRYVQTDVDFTALLPVRRSVPQKQAKKKKRFLLGLLSVAVPLAYLGAAALLLTVFSVISSPDAINIAVLMPIIYVVILPWVCPFITVWGNMAGVILAMASVGRGELKGFAYTVLSVNVLFYVIELIYILNII